MRRLDGKRALERARQIIGLADDLTEDFRRVRDDFEQLNREFRERIIDDEGERGNAVIVRVLSTDVLVISARSLREMAFVAHSLGNRHLPAQFFDADGPFGRDAMVVQYDHTVEDFLRAHDVPHERQERVMDVPFRHAEHTH